jgi:hypothetical protein
MCVTAFFKKKKNWTKILTQNTALYVLNFHRYQIGLNNQLLDV